MENIIPILGYYAGNAYNARKGYFQGAPVFRLSHDRGRRARPCEPAPHGLPEQLRVAPANEDSTWQHTLLMENEHDYDLAFSRMLHGEYVGASFSSSCHSSLLYHGKLFSQRNRIYGLNVHVKQVLRFWRLGHNGSHDLDPAFVDAICSLPPALHSQESLQEYFDFFDTYGTHYVTQGTLGGMIFMETSLPKSLTSSIEPRALDTSLHLAFQGLLASNSFKVDLNSDMAYFLNVYRDTLHNAVDIIGGQYLFDRPITEWTRSLYRMPALLLHGAQPSSPPLTTLAPLSALAQAAGTGRTVPPCLRTALDAYMAPPSSTPGRLPTGWATAATGHHTPSPHRRFMASLAG